MSCVKITGVCINCLKVTEGGVSRFALANVLCGRLPYKPSHDSQSLRTNTKVDQAGVSINPESPQKCALRVPTC